MKITAQSASAAVAILLAIAACNLPSGNPATQDPGAATTATAQTAETEPTPTSQPPTLAIPPTECFPIVTATTDANIRGGPGTGYEVLGYLPVGGTAPLAGRNDANTWWYIEFAGGPGGHAWIAQSVSTASCVPPVVAVVAAPPLPTAPPTTASGGGPFAVTSVSFDVGTFDAGGYDDCPIVTAHITANGEGDVKYNFTRSDGQGGPGDPFETIHFNSAGTKDVTQKWYLGSFWAGGSPEWLGIYIDDPNHQDFGHVNVPACNAP